MLQTKSNQTEFVTFVMVYARSKTQLSPGFAANFFKLKLTYGANYLS